MKREFFYTVILLMGLLVAGTTGVYSQKTDSKSKSSTQMHDTTSMKKSHMKNKKMMSDTTKMEKKTGKTHHKTSDEKK